MKKLSRLFLALLVLSLAITMLGACDNEKNVGTIISKECRVTVDFCGGEIPEDFAESVVISKGSGISELPTPTREGHDFLGWFVGDEPYSPDSTFSKNTTITAKWKAHTFTVTFLDYFGDYIEEQTVDWGTAATPPAVPEKLGELNHQGWDPDISCIKSDLVVTPVYDYSYYTVTFNSSGGTPIASQTVKYNELPVLPEPPEKSAQTFSAWFKDKTLTEEYKFNIALNEDVTLYAYYKKDYTEISTAEQLNNIRYEYDDVSGKIEGKYILVNDISLSADKWEPINEFNGIIDGNGYKIYDFTMSGTDENLGFVNTNNGIIKNLSFDEFAFAYNRANQPISRVGVIAAVNNGTIKNCKLISGDMEMSASLSAAWNHTIAVYFGGLVGINYGTVTECANNVDMRISTSSHHYSYSYTAFIGLHLASIAGLNHGIIKESCAQGTITYSLAVSASRGYASTQAYIGGIAGLSQKATAKISECISEVNIAVTGSGSGGGTKAIYSGGLVGYNDASAVLADSIAKGTVNITNSSQHLGGTVGGAVGTNTGAATATNIFCDVDITIGDAVSASVGGIVGNNAASGVTNKAVFTGDISLGANSGSYGFVFAAQNGSTNLSYYSASSILKKGNEIAVPTNTDGTIEHLHVILKGDFFFNTLSWDSEVWAFEGTEHPTLKCFEK